MRVRVVRIFRDGLQHLLFCLLLVAFLAGRNAEVIVRSGTVWIKLDRLSQFLQRIVEPRLTIMNNAERGEHKIVIRRDGQGFLQR